jgi:hypothetical protein
MNSLNHPRTTVLIRVPRARPYTAAIDSSRLENLALYLLVSAFWGIVLFVALTQAL